MTIIKLNNKFRWIECQAVEEIAFIVLVDVGCDPMFCSLIGWSRVDYIAKGLGREHIFRQGVAR